MNTSAVCQSRYADHHPTASILVIGNEILSGRTHDINVKFIAEHLKQAGIRLVEVRIVMDDESQIISAVNALRSQCVYVFTTGGIGATHDDITAASIAKAFDLPLVEDTAALAILKDHYKERFNDNRRRMALMPKGAQHILNPVSAAPGFFLENVFCLAGMPSVMQASFLLLLPTLKGGMPFISRTFTCDLLEGDIAHALADIQNDHPDVDIGSYPYYRIPPDIGVSFVISGSNEDAVSKASKAVSSMISDFNGVVFEAKDNGKNQCFGV